LYDLDESCNITGWQSATALVRNASYLCSSQEMKIAIAIGNPQIVEQKLDLLNLQFDRMHPGSKLARVQWLSVEDYQVVSYIIPLLRTAVPGRWLVRGIGRGVTRKKPLKCGAKPLT
jgi:hypothetical protein